MSSTPEMNVEALAMMHEVVMAALAMRRRLRELAGRHWGDEAEEVDRVIESLGYEDDE